MKRDFTLKPISFQEFNEISFSLGLPRYESENYRQLKTENNSVREWKRYFYEMLETRVYDGGIEQIRDELREDKDFVPVCVWFPSDVDEKRASIQTIYHGDGYYRELLRKESMFEQLVIRLVAEKNFKKYAKNSKRFTNPQRYYHDSFSFNKDNGLWVLRKVHINAKNFAYYKFRKEEGKGSHLTDRDTYAVCAVSRTTGHSS